MADTARHVSLADAQDLLCDRILASLLSCSNGSAVGRWYDCTIFLALRSSFTAFMKYTRFHAPLAQGSGLVDAAERTPIVAHIVEALARLRDLAQYAKGSRLNCMQLDAFGQDIMRAFDFHGASLFL